MKSIDRLEELVEIMSDKKKILNCEYSIRAESIPLLDPSEQLPPDAKERYVFALNALLDILSLKTAEMERPTSK